jgi:hypothetical protein
MNSSRPRPRSREACPAGILREEDQNGLLAQAFLEFVLIDRVLGDIHFDLQLHVIFIVPLGARSGHGRANDERETKN